MSKQNKQPNYQEIEEIILKMWPASIRLTLDGWIIHLFKPYTHRTNCVHPLYSGTIDISEKIEFCEKVYSKHKLPVTFRVSRFSVPESLDTHLKQLNYKMFNPTNMLFVKLDQIPSLDDAFDDQCEEKSTLTDWIHSHRQIAKYSNDSAVYQKKFHEAITLPKCMMTYDILSSDNNSTRSVSCGMGVLFNEFFGLFDVRTDSDFQNKGYATKLVAAMLRWAKKNGAIYSMLHIDEDNQNADFLYSKFGFKKIYQYWYRIKKIGD